MKAIYFLPFLKLAPARLEDLCDRLGRSVPHADQCSGRRAGRTEVNYSLSAVTDGGEGRGEVAIACATLTARQIWKGVMVKLNLIAMLVVGWALLSGGISRAQVTNATATVIDIYDGFETAGLSKVWDTDRFVPGAVEMQTNIFRAGHGAAKITVRPRDKFETGIKGSKDSERDELLEARKLTSKEDAAYEQSFSMFIPTNFPIVPVRLVIAQWKQNCGGNDNCSDDSPVVAIRYVSGVLKITHQIGPHQTKLYETKEEVRGQWLDFKFQIRFSTNENGRVKAWLNGKQVVDYTGVNAYPENPTTGYTHPGRFYFKMGLYRDLMAEPMTIYIDEYRKKELPGNAL
jgi:hypothetical protein